MSTVIPPLLGVLGLAAAWYIYQLILRYSEGPEKIAHIGREIHVGAMVFMTREYKMLAMFAAVLLVVLWVLLGTGTAVSFLVGAASSAVAGFIGMYTATKANVRTTTAAHEDGAAQALTVAFFGGSIMGLAVASLGLIGLGFLYYLFAGNIEGVHAIEGFGMGASTVALFSRVGGGIFTKSADVGADLVGKVEAGIPEDDPRNPGVIADNVGDNVGDVAGMGSDIFESYCGSMIATIAMAATLSAASLAALGGTQESLMFLPLALASLGLLCSIAGIFIVRKFSDKAPEVALRSGTISATIIFIITSLIMVTSMDITWKVWAAVFSGALGGMIIGLVTEYYTAGKPVEMIAASGDTGSATVIISGLAVGMQSVVIPVLAICGVIWVSTSLVGLYGVGIAAVGMLATVGITMAARNTCRN